MGKVVTTFRCPSCNRRLVIEETMGAVMFGCPNCECYVIVTENKVREYFYGSVFSWRRLMKDLYNTYTSAKRHVCT